MRAAETLLIVAGWCPTMPGRTSVGASVDDFGMNKSRREEPDSSLSVEDRIAQVCDEFEQAWNAGEQPSIDDFLRKHPELPSSILVRDLRAVETQKRLAGEETEAVDYISNFPGGSDLTEAFLPPHPNEGDARTVEFGGDSSRSEGRQRRVSEPIPERLGRFEIKRRLGTGGFGVVYLAYDPELTRDVALKVAHRERFDSKKAMEAFLEEARTAAVLKHAGLVAVYDIQHEAGDPFIVQEFIDGSNLSEWAGANTPTPKQVVQLMVEVGQAVGHAHREGFVHRDLKPHNILIDGDGKPHVADFGLAVHDTTQQRRRGELTGSPAYMSPEQVRGESHLLDGRSDIWSLGVIFYELLVGRRPFSGENRRDLFDQIQTRDPKPIRQIRPAVPRELERICLNCLAKQSADRYRSVVDLVEDLKEWENAELQHPFDARAPVGSKRARWGAVVAALFVLLIVGTAIQQFVASVQRRAMFDRIQAALDFVANTPSDKLADSIVELHKFPSEAVVQELKQRFDDSAPTQKLALACVLADYGEVDLEFLLSNIEEAPDNECGNIVTALDNAREQAIPELRTRAAVADRNAHWRLKSRLAMVALHLGDASIAGDVHSRPDPTQQTVFIHEVFPSWHGDPTRLAEQMRTVEDARLRAGICLAVGNLSEPIEFKSVWSDLLTHWYRESPDSGTHGASDWALRQWGAKPPELVMGPEDPANRDWQVTPHGITMVRVPAGKFVRTEGTTEQTVALTNDFWLSDAEVTVGLFEQFVGDDRYPQEYRPPNWFGGAGRPPTDPAQQVSWEEAVLFCNWLSRKEKQQPCYAVGWSEGTLKVEFLMDEKGYRLPTEAEWEYACRAGTTTAYGFGEAWLPEYGVAAAASSKPVRSKMCNRWGLFDLHGNVVEFCYDRWLPYEGESVRDPVGLGGWHVVDRGGSWKHGVDRCQSDYRGKTSPSWRDDDLGFRVARSAESD